MRKELKFLIYAHLALVLVILYNVFDLLTLVTDNTVSSAFPAGFFNSTEEKKQLIPKILHQTYKTEDIPEVWKAGQQACIDLHPDYEYILWTDEKARNFIETEFPWFLDTFDGYKYNIERADAIRYFVLYKYGGVYLDLDDGCQRKLDPLLSVPAFLRRTTPTGISNDVMGAVPGHAFFEKTINSIKSYDHNWLIPYLTIMYSTGPLFLSVVWKQFKRWGVPVGEEIFVMQPDEYKGSEDSFFLIAQGSSWHQDDAAYIKKLGQHIPLAVFAGFVVAAIVLSLEYAFYRWLINGNFQRISDGLHGIFARNPLPNSATAAGYRRLRKDSNLPVAIPLDDLEKNDVTKL